MELVIVKSQVIKGIFLVYLLLFTNSSWATLITDTNHLFKDLGSSTVDRTTSLEWLDLTETVNLSVSEVKVLLLSDNKLLQGKSGWRYATELDFKGLIYNWFGTEFNLQNTSDIGSQLGSDDHPLVELFISTFGDMICGRDSRPLSDPNCSYATYGYLMDSDENAQSIYHAYVWDDEATGFDNQDIASYSYSNSMGKDNYAGSWLVRENVQDIVTVSEPKQLGLILIFLWMITMVLIKKRSN